MKAILALVITVQMLLAVRAGAAEDRYTFTIENTTDEKIVQLLVSEDGKEWAAFDIGKGVKPKQTVTLEWNEESNEQSCEQKVKAVYEDGSESEEAEFDFCEEDLELEF